VTEARASAHRVCGVRGHATAPKFNVANTVTTKDSITIFWEKGSALTASFLVYGRRLALSRRDIGTGNYTLLLNSTATSYKAEGLASGATYEFSVHAVTADGVANNQASFTFQTLSVADNQALPDGGTHQLADAAPVVDIPPGP